MMHPETAKLGHLHSLNFDSAGASAEFRRRGRCTRATRCSSSHRAMDALCCGCTTRRAESADKEDTGWQSRPRSTSAKNLVHLKPPPKLRHQHVSQQHLAVEALYAEHAEILASDGSHASPVLPMARDRISRSQSQSLMLQRLSKGLSDQHASTESSSFRE